MCNNIWVRDECSHMSLNADVPSMEKGTSTRLDFANVAPGRERCQFFGAAEHPQCARLELGRWQSG
jgi:hypothetical protein